jgi:transposase
MSIDTLGIDLGKTVCHMVALDEGGQILFRRKLRRDQVLRMTANLPACRIGLEACCGAHHLGHRLNAQGHDVRLMPPEYVRPYVKSNKNDDRDAEAIAEAVGRPTMRFVPLKEEAQLDLQAIHRARERLVRDRTALINQVRGFLFERGITVPQGRLSLGRRLPEILRDDTSGISPRIRLLLSDIRAEWQELDRRIDAFDRELAECARRNDKACRLIEIPGIGVTIATALVAAIDNGAAFSRARDLSAWLGLVPKQHTTGGRPRLGGISKRGNVYLRRLLIHGARSVLPHLAEQSSPVGCWLRGLLSRAHRNVAIVALANKMARIAWVVLRTGTHYEAQTLPTA